MKRLPFLLFALLLGSLTACHNKLQNSTPKPLTGFDWQGHRGCRGLKPENTIAAFMHAMEYPGVRTLELDLAVSKDRKLIVSHEPWFNPAICRSPNGDSIAEKDVKKAAIYRMTAAEVKAYDCGSMGNANFPRQEKMAAHKPELAEVIAAARQTKAGRKIRWNIELKSEPDWDNVYTPAVDDFAGLVCAEIQRLRLEKHCNVQSFDPRILRAVHKIMPGLTIGFLIGDEKNVQKNLDILGFKPQAYSPHYSLIDPTTLADCHARGMRLIPWTVNDVPTMRQLIQLGVDGIITDYPDYIETATK